MLQACARCRRHVIAVALVCPFCACKRAAPADTEDPTPIQEQSREKVPVYGGPGIKKPVDGATLPRVDGDGSLGATAGVYGGPPVSEGGSIAPRVEVALSITTSRGNPNDERVVAAMVARVRHCAQAAANSDPTTAGNATITIRVLPTGDADSKATSSSGLGTTEVDCMAKAFSHASFDAGDGGTLVVKVVHSGQK